MCYTLIHLDFNQSNELIDFYLGEGIVSGSKLDQVINFR